MKKRRQKPIGMRKLGMNFLARLAMVLLLSFALVQNAFADIYNDATASGSYQLVPVVSGDSFVSIPVVLNAPTIELLKSSTFNDNLIADGFAQLGETISYQFSVQNTGNVTLTNITVADPTVTMSGGPIASLAPGATDTTTFTATYTLTAPDLLARRVTNSAMVTASPPSGPAITDVSDSQNPGDDTGANNDVTVTSFKVPIDAVNDDFTAAPVSGLTGGSTATVYTNDTLNGVAFPVTTDVTPSIISNGGIVGLSINSAGLLTIPPGTTAATYTVTYQICETANLANCDTADVIVVVTAATIALLKSSTFNDNIIADGFAQLGETISYAFSVQNTGNVTLTNVTVTDPTVTLSGGPIASLAPGATDNTTFTATYTLTAADLAARRVTNSATATGTPPSGPAATDVSDSQNPGDDTGANNDVTVTSFKVPIDAVNDDFSASPVDGLIGGTTVTVYTNDTLNGVAFPITTDVTPLIISNGGIVGLSINSTGLLTIPAGTAAATYTVTYQICETANLANCDTADVIVVVFDDPIVTGTVYFDLDGNGSFGGADQNAGAGYFVELFDSLGVSLGSDTTDASGFYSINAPSGVGYRLLFKSLNGIAVGVINGVTLLSNTILSNQNQPVDPTGVIYNSVTRLPVAGVRVTINNSGGVPLPAACLIDPSQQNQFTDATGEYHFDIVPSCIAVKTNFSISVVNPGGYLAGVSTTLTPQLGVLDVTTCPGDAVPGGSCQMSANVTPPTILDTTIYYLAFALIDTDPALVNNHIAIDPLSAVTSGFTKRALVTQARRGERVPYVITANDVSISPVRIVDIMPPGFDYVAGSALVNGVAQEPTIAGRNLTFDPVVPNAGNDITIELTLIATVAVATGPQVNTVQLINPATDQLIGTARATVTILAEHVFDCGDIIGKVFDDRNRNGTQEEGEPGLAGVRLVTVKGVLITTDKHGRFHVACADIPDADIGSNFILKLDTRTLPTGFKMTTDNPRIVRLTAGKMSKLNFGASITRLVRFDMTDAAFAAGSVELKAQWLLAVDKLMAVLETDKSTLRLTYNGKTSDNTLATDRMAAVEKLITERWSGKYPLSIETRVMGAK